MAEAALSRGDSEMLAHAAFKEVKLVGVRCADIEQFWLKLAYIGIAWIFHTHGRLNRLSHLHFLTPREVYVRF